MFSVLVIKRLSACHLVEFIRLSLQASVVTDLCINLSDTSFLWLWLCRCFSSCILVSVYLFYLWTHIFNTAVYIYI